LYWNYVNCIQILNCVLFLILKTLKSGFSVRIFYKLEYLPVGIASDRVFLFMDFNDSSYV
jgi:hypothetical protein